MRIVFKIVGLLAAGIGSLGSLFVLLILTVGSLAFKDSSSPSSNKMALFATLLVNFCLGVAGVFLWQEKYGSKKSNIYFVLTCILGLVVYWLWGPGARYIYT